MKFTEYLARVRLEDARARLRNPNLRISEIAYDVGFQSLTQFNRTFQRVFGQSPNQQLLDLALSGEGRKRQSGKKEFKLERRPFPEEQQTKKSRESHSILTAPQLFYQVF